MIRKPLTGTAAALALVIAAMLGAAMLAGPAFGLSVGSLVQILVQVTLPGLAALGGAVFWRLYAGAGRPSWPFLFTAAGLVNVVIWAILTLFLSFDEAPPESGETYIDIASLFPFIALGVALVWGICGVVFAWLQARAAERERPQ